MAEHVTPITVLKVAENLSFSSYSLLLKLLANLLHLTLEVRP